MSEKKICHKTIGCKNQVECIEEKCMAWGEVERSSCYHPTSGAVESEAYFGCLLIKKKGE